MTVKTVTSEDARIKMRDILDDVHIGVEVIIERYRRAAAVVVNYAQWQAWKEAQKAAFVYKTGVFSNITTSALLANGVNTAADLSNPAYNYWSSGRYPFLFTADVTMNCVTKRINFVLIHAKANTSPTATSYARRQASATELHDTLMQYFANENVIVLGDFNDDLDHRSDL